MPEGAVERTLVLIKPDGVKRGLVGTLLARFELKGLKIVAARFFQMTPEHAARHYAEHQGKPFFNGLVQHITSGPLLALALEGRAAIPVVRLMTGATNPQTAAPGTLRGDFGLAMTANLIHASDSPASAERELGLFFRPEDYVAYTRSDEPFV
jgi:nucleoside-diphosphate kinase